MFDEFLGLNKEIKIVCSSDSSIEGRMVYFGRLVEVNEKFLKILGRGNKPYFVAVNRIVSVTLNEKVGR